MTSRKNRKTGAPEMVPIKLQNPMLKNEQIADWLGCKISKIEHIKSGDPRWPLSPEDAHILARRTGVSFEWLMGGDPQKPIVSGNDEPYTIAKYEERQSEMKKLSFGNPQTNRDLWRVVEVMADAFGRVAAIVLRALEKGELDLAEFKMRQALGKIYGDKPWTEMFDLIIKSTYNGSKATITRPDPSALLDDWESRFKEIIAKKSNGKLPVQYPANKPLPATQPQRKPVIHRSALILSGSAIAHAGRKKRKSAKPPRR